MNYGVRLAAPMFDTMLAHYVLQPEQKTTRKPSPRHYTNTTC